MKTFLIIFWIHQAIFGLSSLGSVLNLLLEGGTTNQSNLVPLSSAHRYGFVVPDLFRHHEWLFLTPSADASVGSPISSLISEYSPSLHIKLLSGFFTFIFQPR